MKKYLLISLLSLIISTHAHAGDDYDPFAAVEEARKESPGYNDPFDLSDEPDYFKAQKEKREDKIKYLNNKRAADFMQLDTTGQQKPASSQEVLNNMMKTR